MSIPFVFTDHAIRQFQRRHAPEWTFAQCENELGAGAGDGSPTGRLGYRGSKVYRFATLGIEAMVDFNERERTNVVVTVLPVRSGRPIEAAELAEAEARLKAAEERQAVAAKAVAVIQSATPRPPMGDMPHGTTREQARAYEMAKSARDVARYDLMVCERQTAVIRDELKTIRTQISYDTDKEHARRALRLALHALDPVAREAVRIAIAAFDDGLASDEFIGVARAEPPP